ncbi:helix-turn-helix domain-containing protein [Delftia acidovorans]|uniref:helix-turn-helix domain-containing protein n=1 Tax=Delftia acidovorans TaxID=80866 RepID=UPI0035A1C871
MKRVDAEILTVDDLAELFSCDKETAAARLTSGDLPGVKVGRSWIIPRYALLERLNEKAREESAARRAQRLTTSNTAQSLTKAIQAEPNTVTKEALTVLLPNAALNKRGRKRRVPPSLPALSNFSD